MGVAMSMTARYARAGAQAFRLVADARGASRAAGLLLRGSPFALGWFAGWLTTEFYPQVVTGHALARISTPAIGRVGASWAGQRAEQTLTAALEEAFGPDYPDLVSHPTCEGTECAPRAGLLHRPGPHARYAVQTSDISYGPGGRDNLLDIWRRHDLTPGRRAPVLIQVPGGAWTVNGKRGQAYTLMSRMVELGWICVSIDYSKSPRSTIPAYLIDVKRAIAWVRENIADYGGDPSFIAITGGSAGGHLASLAALTPNDPRFQPGFEYADTTVQAAVPYYGVYDFTNAEVMHELMLPFLEQFVMRARFADTPERFAEASPINYVHDQAPPFFVLHGEKDELVPCTQARTFCAAMRAAGAPLVAHAELANAHHAFDILSTARSRLAAQAVADFLGIVYGRRATALLNSWPLSATSAS
ncbi:alpha/beta hydrolase [Mycobacterium genavense]|uniref:esterase LipQ n=1 Tax=Mycobacterium genavense TaxID=36812 RepID=UPI00046F4B72|nr:alpha/beta hydrolase [Mycobacterium genavense]